jgi:hypothetical protein
LYRCIDGHMDSINARLSQSITSVMSVEV